MNKIVSVSEKADKLRSRYFPLKISKSVTCYSVSHDEFFEFVKKEYPKVFKKSPTPIFNYKKGSKTQKDIDSTWEEYQKVHAEYFIFKDGNKKIGWFAGYLEDFETFYLRNVALLPKWQNKGIYSKFQEALIEYVKKLGYQKISCHEKATNLYMLRLQMKFGFFIVGHENHDRWGNLLRLTKFLNKKREKNYIENF